MFRYILASFSIVRDCSSRQKIDFLVISPIEEMKPITTWSPQAFYSSIAGNTVLPVHPCSKFMPELIQMSNVTVYFHNEHIIKSKKNN